MRLLWWRGKKAQPTTPPRQSVASVAVAAAGPRELAPLDPVLALARDYLVATGARVRQEGADLVSATLPDGSKRSFTTSVAVASEQTAVALLVPGSAAFNEILDASANEARLSSFALASSRDVLDLVRESVAAPPASCGECLTQAPGPAFSACDACPLREGRLALRGLGRIRRVTERSRRRSWSAEVSCSVVARDRDGRLDDRVRLAFDIATGEAVRPVSLDALTTATGAPLPQTVADALGAALERAEAALRPSADATAAFLALRAEADYLRRRDEITATFDALRREQSVGVQELDRALAIERQRLDDTFAVSVEVTPESVAFVASDYVEVAVERHGARDLVLTCDAGRGTIVPPVCAACGRPAPGGSVCAEGHVTCAACLHAQGDPFLCRVCDGVAPAAAAEGEPGRGREQVAADGAALSSRSLATVPEHIWEACARWIVEQRGARVETVTHSANGLTLRGQRGGFPISVHTPRSAREWGVSAGDVRRAAAQVVAEASAACILVAPLAASGEARAEAARLGVELWDAAIIQEALDTAASAHERERRAAEAHREQCLALLRSVRGEGLAALEEAETWLATSASEERLTVRGQVAPAVEVTVAGRDVLLQALLAWDTVVADFQAAVGPRPRRDGALAIVAEPDDLQDLLGRVRHLQQVTVANARQVGHQANLGDFGYTEWRQSVLDELVSRCEVARWRLLAHDLDNADDFAKAHDQAAAEKAEAAVLAADRAAARAAQTFAALERRARL